MTIQPSSAEWPMNTVAVLKARVNPYIDADLLVVKRPLRPTDGTQTVGIFPLTKQGNLEEKEISSDEPTLKDYYIVLQSLVQDSDEESGISVHGQLSQMIEEMIYRDSILLVGLRALQVVRNNVVERYQKHDISQTRYLSNEIDGVFIYTSWTEFKVQTETMRVGP